MNPEKIFYSFDHWFVENQGIKNWQNVIHPWFESYAIPVTKKILSDQTGLQGIKCYIGTHDCKGFMLWKKQFDDMIGFDLHNPTNNPYVIQFDYDKCDLIKMPISFCVCMIGSTSKTPNLVRKTHNWINENLVTGGISMVYSDIALSQYTDFEIIEKNSNMPYKDFKNIYFLKKLKGRCSR